MTWKGLTGPPRRQQQDCPYCGKSHEVLLGQYAWYYCLQCGHPLSAPCVVVKFENFTLPKINNGLSFPDVRSTFASNSIKDP